MAFEDTPALAKLREEQRADKNRRSEAEGAEAAASAEAARQEPTPSSKTEKPDAADLEKREPDGKAEAASEKDGVAGEANEPKGEAVAALGEGLTQTGKGLSASGPDPSVTKETPSSPQVGRVAAQEPVQAKAAAVSDGQAKAVASGETSSRPQDAANIPSDATGDKPAAVGGTEAITAETQEATAAVARSDRSKDATPVASKSAAAPAEGSKARQPGEPVASAKVGPQPGAEKAQSTERGGESAPAAHSVAKAGAEASGTLAANAKVEGEEMLSRRASRADNSQPVAGIKSSPESQAAMLSGQGKDGQFAGLGDGTKEQVGVSVSSTATSTAFAERLAGQDTGATASETAAAKNTTQSIGEQILDSVRASVTAGDKQVTIRLDPPELGAVTVRFQEQGDQVRAVMEVSRQDTRQDVERAMPEVLRTLQEAGVQIRRVEVVLSEQSGRDYHRDHLSQQDAWAGQQHPRQQGDTPRQSGSAGWPGTSRSTYAGPAGRQGSPHVGAPTDRIDMLM